MQFWDVWRKHVSFFTKAYMITSIHQQLFISCKCPMFLGNNGYKIIQYVFFIKHLTKVNMLVYNISWKLYPWVSQFTFLSTACKTLTDSSGRIGRILTVTISFSSPDLWFAFEVSLPELDGVSGVMLLWTEFENTFSVFYCCRLNFIPR